MVYLLCAFLVLWGLLFAYLYTIAARQKRLEADIDRLSGAGGDRRVKED